MPAASSLAARWQPALVGAVVLVLTACAAPEGGGSTEDGGGGGPLLQQVTVDAELTLAPGDLSQAVTATGHYEDGTAEDITGTAAWTSTNADVLSVEAPGRIRTNGPGVADVVATDPSGEVQGRTTVSVTDASLSAVHLSVTPAETVVGVPVSLALMAEYSDGSSYDVTADAAWSVSGGDVLGLGGAPGVVAALGSGTATVTATYGGESAQATINVGSAVLESLSIPSASLTLPLGHSVSLDAEATYSDGSTRDVTGLVAWSSQEPLLASVSERGLVRALGVGTATVQASLGGRTATVDVSVTDAVLQTLEITQSPISLPLGLTGTLEAIGTYSDGSVRDVTNLVDWRSSAPGVLTVGSGGVANTLGAGDATVEATLAGKAATVDVTVTDAVLQSVEIVQSLLSLPLGLTGSLEALGRYSDGSVRDVTSLATWSSDAPGLVSVDGEGIVRALALGDATVEASLNGAGATVDVAVTDAVLQALDITQSVITLPLGLTESVQALGTYSDGSVRDLTDAVAWSSDAPLVASVNAEGVVRALSLGSATVEASLGGNSATVDISVVQAVLENLEVVQSALNLPLGFSQTLEVLATYSDGSVEDVSDLADWQSSPGGIATVGSGGVLHALGVGETDLQASYGGETAQVGVTVTSAVLTGLEIVQDSLALPLGVSQPLQVTGTYSDGSTADLTSAVTWSSDQPSLASVTSSGMAQGLSVGSTRLEARLNGHEAAVPVTVVDAVLESITVAPADTSVSLAESLIHSFTATGHYSDGTTADLSGVVQWSSDDTGVALVDTLGRIITVAVGTVTVTAEHLDAELQDTASLEVTLL